MKQPWILRFPFPAAASDDEYYADKIRNTGQHIKSGRHEVEKMKVINKPHQLSGDDDGFEKNFVLRIECPGEGNGRDHGEPSDNAVLIADSGECCLDRDEEDLPANSIFPFQADKVAGDADEVRNSACDSAEDQIADPHDKKLDILKKQHIALFLHEADKDHQYGAGKCDDISKKYSVHDCSSPITFPTAFLKDAGTHCNGRKGARQYKSAEETFVDRARLVAPYTAENYILFSLSEFSDWLVEQAAHNAALELVTMEELYRT